MAKKEHIYRLTTRVVHDDSEGPRSDAPSERIALERLSHPKKVLDKWDFVEANPTDVGLPPGHSGRGQVTGFHTPNSKTERLVVVTFDGGIERKCTMDALTLIRSEALETYYGDGKLSGEEPDVAASADKPTRDEPRGRRIAERARDGEFDPDFEPGGSHHVEKTNGDD